MFASGGQPGKAGKGGEGGDSGGVKGRSGRLVEAEDQASGALLCSSGEHPSKLHHDGLHETAGPLLGAAAGLPCRVVCFLVDWHCY